ncbi:MAG TPA: FtsX-like permease family protein [Candidatus Limivicinus faecipullorum]|nr:FtsX-like permease family protein [Candidatus Limivicinus faecipullorum]
MDILITSTIREIKNSLGRYLAILTIIALGVGLFSGLRICRPMLVDSADEYFTEQNFYDYRIVSTIGFSQDNVFNLAEQDLVKVAEGGCYEDVLVNIEGNDLVFRANSITSGVNRLRVVSGRMPESEGECVLDADNWGEEMLGQTISFSEANSQETLDEFSRTEFTVVGLVTSPLYINMERGTSPLGNGHISSCMYIDRDCFTADYYEEVFLTIDDKASSYSDEYDARIEETEDEITALAEDEAQLRYKELVLDNRQEIADGRQTLDEAAQEIEEQKADAAAQVDEFMSSMGFSPAENPGYYNRMMAEIEESFADAEAELADYYADLDEAEEELEDIDEPTVYVLTRSENAGYAAFEHDSAIIENISVVFPVFFFLVAALVCVTTMTRMVDEQRTQIGVWKAMGYDKSLVSLKYIIYAGSSGFIGSVLGFFIGTYFIPKAFWNAYSSMYNFTEALIYSFDPLMFAASLAVALLCTAGVGLYSCRRELREVPASILRPKAPKNGKRIFLERIGWLWKRISFLHKVSLRNVMRYKQRFFLMILGVSGCTALLLTGFGVRDSIQNVTDYQYGEISVYDAELNFTDPISQEQQENFQAEHQGLEEILYLSSSSVDIGSRDNLKSSSLSAVMSGELEDFIKLRCEERAVSLPGEGEILLSKGMASMLGVEQGDSVTVTNDEFRSLELTVCGVFDNYISDYMFVTPQTLMELEGETPVNTAYVIFQKDVDQNTASAQLLDDELVSRVALNQDTKNSVDSSFSSLNIIVVLIILCAGALAFIVLFNLININIGERIREIATIKVLGFYNGESSAYVFREVNMLTVLGALLGLGLGKLLHAFVMTQIRTDGICFDVRIAWQSYVFSLLLTFGFAVLVRIAMSYKLSRISMSESLKAVE